MTLLSETECWELLAGRAVGRLVTCVDDEPHIFPVNYAVQRRTILFRTGEGAKLISVGINKQVAFEADDYGFDECGHGAAWSVVVEGVARTLHTPDQIALAEQAQVLPWTAGRKDHYVRIFPTRVTGRRFTLNRPEGA
ncbi:pyridoxamine 5'-phosphate oxidase-like protein [Mycolicibacterium thermoresistibile ATCC 19527]|uniref:Pyridoxamine 5'-phosphate oxidase-like protein n=1 Tax=Mycolicibacterium thermoresistibile (strain ATCC 19527 / DSM 44167 / CIP 105390 / JCM 6362 / NCTC 10409 / 316) TaxID=1078020 RepID=G7CC56_MYCT3|nr:pyridoxamine 5'-phosphate oxidase-like protein [Mycolicibacterium thermoresistibile ATCC 19527]